MGTSKLSSNTLRGTESTQKKKRKEIEKRDGVKGVVNYKLGFGKVRQFTLIVNNVDYNLVMCDFSMDESHKKAT